MWSAAAADDECCASPTAHQQHIAVLISDHWQHQLAVLDIGCSGFSQNLKLQPTWS